MWLLAVLIAAVKTLPLVTPMVVGLVAVKCYNYSLDQFFLLVVVFCLEVIDMALYTSYIVHNISGSYFSKHVWTACVVKLGSTIQFGLAH
jgi:hypothetical protein